MVAAYVATGFRKVHLDCSMACASDPEPPCRKRKSCAAQCIACAAPPVRVRAGRRRIEVYVIQY